MSSATEQLRALRGGIDTRGETWSLMSQAERRFVLQQAGADYLTREQWRGAKAMRQEERAKRQSEAGKLAALPWSQIPAEWRGRISNAACALSFLIDRLK